MNGISNKMSNNDRLEKAKEIHDELEVDITAYNKHGLNLQHCLNVKGRYGNSRPGVPLEDYLKLLLSLYGKDAEISASFYLR